MLSALQVSEACHPEYDTSPSANIGIFPDASSTWRLPFILPEPQLTCKASYIPPSPAMLGNHPQPPDRASTNSSSSIKLAETDPYPQTKP